METQRAYVSTKGEVGLLVRQTPVSYARPNGEVARLPESSVRQRGSIVGGTSKRIFDIVFSSVTLILSAPLILVCIMLVKVTSRGPALFWTPRHDNRGGTFQMPKLRTMRVGAPLVPREQLSEVQTSITPIGHLLRKTSIDELPQLVTILTGRMSIIGPRPVLPVDPTVKQRNILQGTAVARAGLTGLAQVRGRNTLTPRQKARYDQFYTKRWSWKLDAWILIQTVKVVVSRAGVL